MGLNRVIETIDYVIENSNRIVERIAAAGEERKVQQVAKILLEIKNIGEFFAWQGTHVRTDVFNGIVFNVIVFNGFYRFTFIIRPWKVLLNAIMKNLIANVTECL